MAGKGDKPRKDFDKSQYDDNFDDIPDFGFKPKWMIELEQEETSTKKEETSTKKKTSRKKPLKKGDSE
jgi:hypothetical protein